MIELNVVQMESILFLDKNWDMDSCSCITITYHILAYKLALVYKKVLPIAVVQYHFVRASYSEG